MKEFDNWGMKEKIGLDLSSHKGVSVYKSKVIFTINNKIQKKKSDWSISNSRALHFESYK